MFAHAIVRKPGPDFHLGITTSDLGTPNYELILAQHKKYVDALEQAGVDTVVMEPLPGFPDAYFIEDVAVVTPDVAVMTNPGAEARRGEVGSVAEVFSDFRPLMWIVAPGTLDGGDVMMVGRHFFIGLSERTNPEGAAQLGAILKQYGNTWNTIPVSAGLHLKSVVGSGGRRILTEPGFDAKVWFADYDRMMLDRADGYAANSVVINDSILTPKGFPRVSRLLGQTGLKVIEVDASEARKMDGGLSCLSLRF